MKRILTAVILIPLVLLAVLRAPLWLFLLITVVVAMAAVFEYLGIAAGYGFEPFRLLTYLYTSALFVVYYYAEGFGGGALLAGLLMLFLFAPFLLMIAAMGREDLKTALPGAAMSYLALPYIGLPLLLMATLRESARGWVYVLFTFFAVWMGDTAAMYVGKSMGRHKLAPRISPGKTVEGAVHGLARRSDHVGHLLIGQTQRDARADRGGLAEILREIQQERSEARTDVLRGRRGDQLVGCAQPLRKRDDQQAPDARAAVDQSAEVVAFDDADFHFR